MILMDKVISYWLLFKMQIEQT